MAQPTQRADLNYGLRNEHVAINVLQNHLNTTLRRRGGYSVFDYESLDNTIEAELKSRRIPHDRYPTSIIGQNKVEYCTDPAKKYYFAYQYEDGLFIVQYNKELFDTFQVIESFERSARMDCKSKAQNVVLIPREHLSRVVNAA
jgi:hypothetical protein